MAKGLMGVDTCSHLLKCKVSASLSIMNGMNGSAGQNGSSNQGDTGGSKSSGIRWGGSVLGILQMLSWTAAVCLLSTA